MSEITSKQITHHFELTNAKIERLSQDVLGLHKSQNEIQKELHETKEELNKKLDQVIEAISTLSTKINYIDATNAYITRDIYNLNRKA